MRALPAFQGGLYIATGLWPVLHLRSFERVTGPKADGWLAQSMGGLIAAVGTALLAGARRPRTQSERVLGLAAAAALAGGSLLFSLRGRVSRVYLLDGLLEAAIVAGWLRDVSRRGL